MADIPLLGRSKKSFSKFIQQQPKELQKEWELLLHSILFKNEQEFTRNKDSGESAYTGKDGYFWGVDETNGESVLIQNTSSNLDVDVTDFDGILSATDADVQTALDTIDDHNHDTDYISIIASPTAGNFPAQTAGGELVDSGYDQTSFLAAGTTEFAELEVGDATNYLDIDTHGFLTLNGTATAWEDLRVPVTSTKLGGSKDPAFAKVKDDGSGSQGVFGYHFDASSDKELYFTVQLPHSWKEESKIWAHVHWCPEIDEDADPQNTVVWGLEYTWANIGDVFGNTSFTSGTETGPFTAYTHTLTGFGTGITATDKTHSSMLICRVFRDVSEDNYTGDAILLEIDFHFEVWRFGTDTNPSDP